jgi:hypothetical protein
VSAFRHDVPAWGLPRKGLVAGSRSPGSGRSRWQRPGAERRRGRDVGPPDRSRRVPRVDLSLLEDGICQSPPTHHS